MTGDNKNNGPEERPWVKRLPLPVPPQQDWLIIYPAWFAPIGLSLVAIVAGVIWSWWWLVAIPFVWLGSICAAPNLNLADGCLSYLAAGAAFIILRYHPPLGQAILTGVIAGYAAGFAEKMITKKPAPKDEAKQE